MNDKRYYVNEDGLICEDEEDTLERIGNTFDNMDTGEKILTIGCIGLSLLEHLANTL